MKLALVPALVLVLTACRGPSSDAGSYSGPGAAVPPIPDAGPVSSSPDAGPFDIAAHIPFPQMPSHTGSTLPKLQLVTVTFQGYPYRSFVESFGDFVVGSQWLATVTQDYGPLTATHLGKYVLDAPPGGASSDFASILQSALAAGKLPFPSDPAGLLFLVYAPLPCSGGGYHSYFTYSGVEIAYAVGMNCEDQESAEGVMTHEIAEAASDPFLDAYYFDNAQLPWIGEVGDICNFADWSVEGSYRFVGIWSNKAAASGGSPCVPFSLQGYFNVSPSPSEPQTVDAGSSVTFTLTGWSTASVPDWPLYAFPDNYARQDFDPHPSLSANSINNGRNVTLTLFVPGGTPSGATATVRIASAVGGGFSNDWSLQVRAR